MADAAANDTDFDPALHPRDSHGRFRRVRSGWEKALRLGGLGALGVVAIGGLLSLGGSAGNRLPVPRLGGGRRRRRGNQPLA